MLALLALVAMTVAIRSAALTRPLLGNFATKSVVFGMIVRNWAEGRTSLWYPTLDVLVGGKRSLHMLEFPVSAYASGVLWRAFGGSLEAWGRGTAVAWMAGSVVLLHLLVRRRHGDRAAIGAATLLALSPLSVIYGQSFMLDSSLVFLSLAAFYGLDRWFARGRAVWLAVAAIGLALLLLTKVYLAVLFVPLAAELAKQSGSAIAPTPRAWRAVLTAAAALGLAVVPAAAWSWHCAQTAAPDSPMASHVFDSVRKSAGVYFPPDPLLRAPEFYRRILDDLAGVVLTPLGLALALGGLLDREWRRYAAWLASMVLLVALLPRKFHEMNYYWVAVLPPLCILAGLGWKTVCERMQPSRGARAALLAVTLVFSLRYAARPAFVTPEEDRPVPAAGAAVAAITEPDEPVVTMHGSTIDLLYYCGRPGWALSPDDPQLAARLESCRRQGARLAVVVGEIPPPLAGLTVRDRGEGWTVLALR